MDKAPLKKQLVSVGTCPPPSELFAYSKNNTIENTRKIELHIASCKLCSDAIEGFEKVELPIEMNSSKTNKLAKNKNSVKSTIIVLVIGSILGLIYILNNQKIENKNEIKEEIINCQKNDTTPLPEKIKNTTINNESSNALNKDVKIAVKSKVEINPINKISVNKINENKISDSLVTQSNSTPKREFFKSAFPIKYVNSLKAIDYQHLYENIEERNIPVLKSLDPRYENLKTKIENIDNLTEQKLSYNEVLATALLAFSNGDFETCERYFTLILNTYPDDQNATFYRGVSFYKQNRISQAIPLLEKISLRSSSPFMEEAQWHLANCYKEENKIMDMKLVLQKLINKNGFYSEKAKLLLNQY